MMMQLARDGYVVFDAEPGVLRWAKSACEVAHGILAGPIERRHGDTWFVGVDALPNAADGSVNNAPLEGRWRDFVDAPDHWHAAQLSVVFPGYPRPDPHESAAAHRYRLLRDAAHVDGLLPEGAGRRRHLREPHGFVLGLPLNDVTASPLVVWRGSHLVMCDGFMAALSGVSPADYGNVDLTEAYHNARRKVFEECPRIPVVAKPGQAILLHRHLLHGVAPWGDAAGVAPRMIAYFRPLIDPAAWLDNRSFPMTC